MLNIFFLYFIDYYFSLTYYYAFIKKNNSIRPLWILIERICFVIYFQIFLSNEIVKIRKNFKSCLLNSKSVESDVFPVFSWIIKMFSEIFENFLFPHFRDLLTSCLPLILFLELSFLISRNSNTFYHKYRTIFSTFLVKDLWKKNWWVHKLCRNNGKDLVKKNSNFTNNLSLQPDISNSSYI